MFFEEFTSEKLVQAMLAVLFINIVCSLFLVRRVKSKKQAVIYVSLISPPLIFISGAYIGTFYSHGIDLPWLVHGFVVSVPSFLIGVIIIGFAPMKWLKR